MKRKPSITRKFLFIFGCLFIAGTFSNSSIAALTTIAQPDQVTFIHETMAVQGHAYFNEYCSVQVNREQVCFTKPELQAAPPTKCPEKWVSLQKEARAKKQAIKIQSKLLGQCIDISIEPISENPRVSTENSKKINDRAPAVEKKIPTQSEKVSPVTH